MAQVNSQIKKIKNKTLELHRFMQKILFIGLGRIGLPQSLVFANKGFKVYGFDADPLVIEGIRRLQIPFYEPKVKSYLKKNLNKKFFPLSCWNEISNHLIDIDAIFFTIGTQVMGEQDALAKPQLDISGHYKVLDNIFSQKNKFKKTIGIIFRTTFPVGSTDLLKDYIESKYSIKESKDFYLAFIPERIIVGKTINEEESLPKIIGTYTDTAFKAAKKIFKKIGGKLIRVHDPKTAEFCKLTDNAFRSTLFAYANELAMHASGLGIDAKEVINAVNDGYARNHLPMPGYVSGYCLEKDPYIFELNFLKNKEGRDFQSVWYYGRKTNDYLTKYTVLKVLKHLKNPAESCVAILGMSFKGDTDDFRMSHSIHMIEMLIEHNVRKLKIYDPFLGKGKYTAFPEKFLPYLTATSDVLTEDFLTDVNAIIICTMHHSLLELSSNKKVKLLAKTKKPCYLFDGYNIWGEAKKIPHMQYESLGQPTLEKSDA